MSWNCANMARFLLVFVTFLGFSCRTYAGVEIREGEKEGKKIVEIENDLYLMTIAPEIARLPLSYFFKPTGHEEFIHPAGLGTPNEGFQYYGGIIDSIPWVSGTVGNERLPEKGYLYSSRWQWKTGKEKDYVFFDGETQFDYQDPVTREKMALLFKKRITGYADSSRVRMDYLIKNIGDTEARFTFSAHSRIGVGGSWDEGDYFFAPGETCLVYEMRNLPELTKEGIKAGCWARWPLKQATEFMPQKEFREIFAYVPSNWCVAGDEKYKESVFFVSGPVSYPGRTDVMKMGIFMTNTGYVVEPCLTYSIEGNPDKWEIPGATIVLKPAKECEFTMNLVAYKDISKQCISSAYAVYPECLFLAEPRVTVHAGRLTIAGVMAFPGKGKVMLKVDGKSVKEKTVGPGIFDLGSFGAIPYAKNKKVSLFFNSTAGSKELYETPSGK